MSDYFGALLRSAGPAPVAVGRGSIAVPDSGTLEHAFESVEAPPVRTPQAYVPTPGPPAARAAGEDFADPQEASQNAPHEAPQKAPHDALHDAPSVASPRPAAAGETHPALRAALDWVGADPFVVERIVPGMPRAQRVQSAVASAAQASASPASPVVAQPAHALPGADGGDAQPARDAAPRPMAAAALRPAPAAAPEAAFELDLDVPRAPRAAHANLFAKRSAAPAPPGQVEISIGTIHVSVDAPPAARAVVQPAAAPQRMAPAAPAARSAFSRARLPRS